MQHSTSAMLPILSMASLGVHSELTGPVNYIIPFGPGGESDISARMQQSFFKEKFGQDLVVSYKPGGGGAVGWASLNGSSGDGQTIIGTFAIRNSVSDVIIMIVLGVFGWVVSRFGFAASPIVLG